MITLESITSCWGKKFTEIDFLTTKITKDTKPFPYFTYSPFGEDRKPIWPGTYLTDLPEAIHLGRDIQLPAGTLIYAPVGASHYKTISIIFAILKITLIIAIGFWFTSHIASTDAIRIFSGIVFLFYLLKTIYSTYEELNIINNFNKEWNVSTLLIIRDEFNSCDAYNFLCIGSPTFKTLWSSSRHLIQYLASEFMETTNYNQHYYIGSSYLFCMKNTGVYLKSREVRLAFIEHEINRLTTNDKTI